MSADDADEEATVSPTPPGQADTGFDIDYPRAVLIGLVVVVSIALLVAGSTSTTAFGAYNPAWDGTAELRTLTDEAGAETEILRNVSGYDDVAGNDTIALVLSPRRPYSDADTRRLRAFVERGGTLVVAEDFGRHANPLLERVGASARINGSLLRDERFHYRGPALPVAENVTETSALSNHTALTLNHGTAVEPGSAQVLVRTSEFAYRDRNRDGTLNDNETMAAIPVVTAEQVGDGRVVVVGDPSLFINAMLERRGNRAFVRSLFDTEQVVLDYSHTGGIPPLMGALFTLRASPLLAVLVGLAGVVALALWGHTPGLVAGLRARLTDTSPDAAPHDREAVVAAVLERHPEYSEQRLRRIMGEIINDADEPGVDD